MRACWDERDRKETQVSQAAWAGQVSLVVSASLASWAFLASWEALDRRETLEPLASKVGTAGREWLVRWERRDPMEARAALGQPEDQVLEALEASQGPLVLLASLDPTQMDPLMTQFYEMVALR